MISYKESLKILKRTKALLEGHFVLSSGLHSDKYIQCAKLLSHPQQSRKICSSLKAKKSKVYKKIDIILSPAMGGIIVGYEISRQLNVVSIFAERVGGKLILRRGFSIPKKSRVLRAFLTINLADCFSEGATESSRSNIIASGLCIPALSINFA